MEEKPEIQEPSVDWKEFIQACNRAGELLSEACTAYGEAVVQAFQPIWNSVQPAIDALYAALSHSYHKAGAPYGESPEELLTWMDVVSKTNHAAQISEAQIERMKQRSEEQTRQIDARIHIKHPPLQG